MIRKPYTKEDFAWVDWTPVDIEKAAVELLRIRKERTEAVKAIPPAERTYENTVYALDMISDEVPYNCIEVLLNTSPDAEVRKAAEAAVKRVNEESVEMDYDEGLYHAFKEYADAGPKLEGEEARVFKDTADGFRRMGFGLPPEKRDEVKELVKRMNELSTDFSLNLQNYHDFILVTPEELEGLPEHFIEGLEKSEDGRHIVSLKYPELGPFLDFAENSAKREELAHKNLRKGGEKNLELARELKELRLEHARLLGYASPADYTTELRMAKSGKNVEKFLADFMTKLQPLADRDVAELTDAKRRHTKDPNAKLEYYDVNFYWEWLQKERFSFDPEKVREWFPLERVMERMFSMFQTLYGISFKKADITLWHPDVIMYEVSDGDGLIGNLFFDLFPRPNKYDHMACFPVVYARRKDYKSKEYVPPLVGVIGNFKKPTPTKPSLLSHYEVTVLFHEVGHTLHSLFTSVDHRSMGGVAWDFVEVPSQLNEAWVWDPEMLKSISHHYVTKEPLPDELIGNLVKTRRFMGGYGYMRQCVYSWWDIVVHGPDGPGDMTGFYRQLMRKHVHLELPSDILWPGPFGHFIGYSAGYYSYLWSEVLCADMWSRFKAGGLLNPDIGREYREKVLSVGRSRDELDSVRDFLGREPGNEAFLKELGL